MQQARRLHQHRVPRMLLIVVLLLVAGAIVNIAVAWGCAMWNGLDESNLTDERYGAVEWVGYVPNAWPNTPDWGLRWDGVGLNSVLRQSTLEREQRLIDLYRILTFDAGVPMRSMRWELHGVMSDARGTLDYFPDESSERSIVRTGFRVRGLPINQDQFRFWRRLPLDSIWPGFAINTLFYAAILWLLFAAPFALRRRMRIQRALCPACAYPVGASDVCTECGRRVTPRRGVGV